MFPNYPGSQFPGYPPQPGYPPMQPGSQFPGYPPQQFPGYPPQQMPGYPPMQPGFPGAYPPMQPGYPQQWPQQPQAPTFEMMFNQNLQKSMTAVFETRPDRNHTAVFKNNNGKLTYYYLSKAAGGWAKDDTTFAGFPVGGDMSCVFEPRPDRNHSAIFYVGQDKKLHYWYLNTKKGCWDHDDTTFCMAGQVSGAVSAVWEPQRNHSAVFCKGEDGYLHYFYLGSDTTWKHDGDSFKVAGKVMGEIQAVYEEFRHHSGVFFQGVDGKIHYFYLNKGVWNHDSTSFDYSGCSGPFAAVYEPQRHHSALFVRGNDGYLCYYYLHGQTKAWAHDSDAFKVAGHVAPDSDIFAVFEDQRNHSAVVFKGEDQKLHYFYLSGQTKAWAHDGGMSSTFAGENVATGRMVALYEPFRKHISILDWTPQGVRYHYLNQGVWGKDLTSLNK